MTRQKRTAATLTVGAAALVCAPLTTASANTSAVEMRNYAFTMPTLQVAVGDTVTWTNQDTALHDATSTAGPASFASPELKTGQSWSYTFTQPGTYQYMCALHPKMLASITAVGSPPTPAATPKVAPKPAAVPAAKPATKPAPGARLSKVTAAAAPAAVATAGPTPTPTLTPSSTPKPKPARTPKAIAAAPVTPGAAAAPVAAAPAVALPAIGGANDLNLMPAVEAGGAAVAIAVLGLLTYGFRAGRRTG